MILESYSVLTADSTSNFRGVQSEFYCLLMIGVKIAYLFLHTVLVVS